jgi:phosphatidylethanolamine/phosphatidyl-N-methylethanolamine N-methyltransferase
VNRRDILRAYDRYAPVYDIVFGAALENGRRAMLRAVAAEPVTRLLEVGVGTGLTLHHYPRHAQVVGLDLSFAMLDKARRSVARRGLQHVTLVCGDAEALPFADASFDCVTLPYVLSVTPDPTRLMHESKRVCTPGGRVLIVNHFRGAGGWRWAESLAGGFADRVGFDSQLDMASTFNGHAHSIERVEGVNLGLSKLVVLRND